MKSNKNIWILEDESGAQFVYQEILGIRHTLHMFSNIEAFAEGLKVAQSPPDLIIADLRLQNEMFFDFFSRAEKLDLPCPFIIVSSIDDLDVLRACFKYGALDYMTKPFTRNELIVKVERILSLSTVQNSLDQEITIEPTALQIRKGKESFIQLTVKEFQIFSIFYRNKSKPISRETLQSEVWKDVSVSAKTLDVHLFNLREKLSPMEMEIRYVPPSSYILLEARPISGTPITKEVVPGIRA